MTENLGRLRVIRPVPARAAHALIGRRVIHVARDGEITTDLRAVGSPVDGWRDDCCPCGRRAGLEHMGGALPQRAAFVPSSRGDRVSLDLGVSPCPFRWRAAVFASRADRSPLRHNGRHGYSACRMVGFGRYRSSARDDGRVGCQDRQADQANALSYLGTRGAHLDDRRPDGGPCRTPVGLTNPGPCPTVPVNGRVLWR